MKRGKQAMLLLLLAGITISCMGCGKKEDAVLPTPAPTPTTVIAEETPCPTAAPEPAPSAAPAPSQAPSAPEFRRAQVTDLTLAEAEKVSAVLIRSRHTEEGFELELYLMNRTDHEIEFTISELTADDVMHRGSFSFCVPANSGTYESVEYPEEELQGAGISFVRNLNFRTTITDPSAPSAEQILADEGTSLYMEV